MQQSPGPLHPSHDPGYDPAFRIAYRVNVIVRQRFTDSWLAFLYKAKYP